MEAYLNNPFPVAGVTMRAFTPRTEEKIMVNPDDGETYAVRHISKDKLEEHDPMQYTKVFAEAHFKVRKLSYTALKIFNYAVHRAALNKDIVLLNSADVMQQCDISQASFYNGIKELCKESIIARKVGSSLEFWINPNIFFNGNRLKLKNRLQ